MISATSEAMGTPAGAIPILTPITPTTSETMGTTFRTIPIPLSITSATSEA